MCCDFRINAVRLKAKIDNFTIFEIKYISCTHYFTNIQRGSSIIIKKWERKILSISRHSVEAHTNISSGEEEKKPLKSSSSLSNTIIFLYF